MTVKQLERPEDIEKISVFISSKVTATVIDALPGLKVIAARSAGTDHIDVTYAASKNITLAHVASYGPHVIATHAIGLLLYGIRSLGPVLMGAKTGKWGYEHNTIRDLRQMTAGVIGTGKIGQEIIKLLLALGCRIIATDVYESDDMKKLGVTYVPMDELLKTTDIIVLACNASADNTDLINTAAIDLMKEGVILINIARGSLIDEQALQENISKLSYVGLDTIKNESDAGLQIRNNYPTVTITPHIAYLADSSLDIIRNTTYTNLSL